MSSTHLDNALLAIDLFPRCALLLLIFEKLPVEDVATLLNADKALVKEAEEIALTQLARNIALEQGWAPRPALDERPYEHIVDRVNGAVVAPTPTAAMAGIRG